MEKAASTLIGIPEPGNAPAGEAADDLRSALERHHADCVGWALACCSFDGAEANDVLQDSYLKVLDGRAVFRGESSFRTWLFGVVRRTAAEYRRSIVRRLSLRLRAARQDARTAAPDAGADVERNELAARVRSALGKLPVRQREVLWLVFQQELTVEAAAAVMRVSVGSARTHYARGKARMRELLGSDER